MRTEPILKLKNEEEIRSMFCDPSTGSVLVGTSQGRILLVKNITTNAYLAGDRTIYATRRFCHGKESSIVTLNVKYGLMNRIVEIANNMTITNWKNVINPTGAEANSIVSGVFTTPVLWAGEDFGWWGDMLWTQVVGTNSRVVMAVRAASTEESLFASSWKTYEETSSGNKSWSLDFLSTAGGYSQIKIILSSTENSDNPVISNLVLPYYSKHASYFFITKIAMTKGTAIRGGLLTASVTTPRNTEIKWGVSDGKSGNWNDFTRITPDKLFSLPDDFGDRMKIGAKLLVYDGERYPRIDEFSVAFDSDIDNLINKD